MAEEQVIKERWILGQAANLNDRVGSNIHLRYFRLA